MRRHRSISRRCFDAFNIVFMCLIIVLMLFPYLNVLAKALNDGADSARGGILFWPRVFTWDNFATVIGDEGFGQALFISVARAVCSVVLTIVVQFMCAYVFTYKGLVGRSAILLYLMIPGYFGGGLIPTYILYSKIGLLNNFLCYVIPGMFNMYNMIIIRTYMNSLPLGLKEAAKIDGASEIKILFRIIMPLCKPIMATIALWVAVGDWNDWTTTMYYFTRKFSHLYPLSYLLQQVLK